MYNKLLQVEDVEHILNQYGAIGDDNQPLRVNDIALYRTACVHTTYMDEMDLSIPFVPLQDWNRLEFVGDKALAYISAFELFARYPDAQEAMLTNLTIGLTRQSRLTDYGLQLNLAEFMLLPPSQDALSRNNITFSRLHASNLEDMVESFIGAIVIDNGGLINGLKYAHRFMLNLMSNLVDFTTLEESIQDYKGPLINELQVLRLGELKVVKLHRNNFAISTYGVAVETSGLRRLFGEKADDLADFQYRMHMKLNSYDLSECPHDYSIIGVGHHIYGAKKADKVQQACKEALLLLNRV